jgi:hypothetical protein
MLPLLGHLCFDLGRQRSCIGSQSLVVPTASVLGLAPCLEGTAAVEHGLGLLERQVALEHPLSDEPQRSFGGASR